MLRNERDAQEEWTEVTQLSLVPPAAVTIALSPVLKPSTPELAVQVDNRSKPPKLPSYPSSEEGKLDLVLDKLSAIERRLDRVEQALTDSGKESHQRSDEAAHLPTDAASPHDFDAKLEEILQCTIHVESGSFNNNHTIRRCSPVQSHHLSGMFAEHSFGACVWSACQAATTIPVEWLLDFWFTLPVGDPGGWSIWLWSCGMVIACVYIATVVPLQVGFPELFTRTWDLLTHAIDCASLLNLVVKARTCFVSDGMLVTDPIAITTRYLHSQFALDAVTALPFSWIALALPPEWFLLHILMVMRPLVWMLRRNAWAERFFRFNPGMQRVAPLLLLLLCSCHWAGCLYWGVSQLDRQEDTPTTWLPSEWVRQQGVYVRYASGQSV